MSNPPSPTSWPPLLFLPGASGRASFWRPVAERLDLGANDTSDRHRIVGWPGVGGNPADPSVDSYRDLTDLVAGHLHQPTVIVAQSMGGVAAVTVALEHPELVAGLILTATSGGIDVDSLGATDWRSSLDDGPAWIYRRPADVSARLPGLNVPTLLLWAENDPISPQAVGRELDRLLPRSELVVLSGDDHGFAANRADEVAPLLRRFLDRLAQPQSSSTA